MEVFAVKDQDEEWHCNNSCCKNHCVYVIHPGADDFKVASAIPQIEENSESHLHNSLNTQPYNKVPKKF
jgi:hypothetical protein